MKNVDVFFLWNLVRRHWMPILGGGLLGILISAGITIYLIKPVYRSNVSLYIGRYVSESPETQNSPGGVIGAAQELTLAQLLLEDYRAIADSRRIQFRLQEKIEATNPALIDIPFEIDFEPVRKTRLCNIIISSPNPELCQTAANMMAEIFIDEIQNIVNIKNSRIIDPAIYPREPFSPSLQRNLALGGLLGALAVFGLVFLRNLFDCAVRTPEDVERELKSPLIGTIPVDAELLSSGDNRGGPAANRIFTLPQDRLEFSAIAECFRILRTNLQYSLDRRDGEAKVFVFTSALPGEGKTFTASNLIVSLADAGKKCLIVNCDLRKPALGKIFGIKNQVGLVNVLVGEAGFEEVVRRRLFELPLDVLLCGPIPPNPSKLLLGDDFRSLLGRLKKEYDYIFLDAPPCLTLADASILAPLCDGVVFVIQAGRTDSTVSQQALNQLRQLNFNIAGVVLNRFSFKEAGSFGYRDYSYYGNANMYTYTFDRAGAKSPAAMIGAGSWGEKVGRWLHRHG